MKTGTKIGPYRRREEIYGCEEDTTEEGDASWCTGDQPSEIRRKLKRAGYEYQVWEDLVEQE